MKNIIILNSVFFITSKLLFAQVSGVVLDSITNNPVPYVNIWVEGKESGTTSDENGYFILPLVDSADYLIFSAVGYDNRSLSSGNSIDTVYLKAKSFEIPEFVVSGKKVKRKQISIDTFKKSQIEGGFLSGNNPWILAKFFPFKAEYQATPFVKAVKIHTESKVPNAKFNIRLYFKGENGEPGECINKENLLGVAKKGKNITEIDLTEFGFSFPEEGFFVAIEILMIEENKFEEKYSMQGKIERIIHGYAPKIGCTSDISNEHFWNYMGGSWKKPIAMIPISGNRSEVPDKYYGKYSLPLIELVLSN